MSRTTRFSAELETVQFQSIDEIPNQRSLS